jgi:hypothetical protein
MALAGAVLVLARSMDNVADVFVRFTWPLWVACWIWTAVVHPIRLARAWSECVPLRRRTRSRVLMALSGVILLHGIALAAWVCYVAVVVLPKIRDM